MEQAPKISETVYVVMCWIVGTPTQVSIRREVADISDMLKKPVKPHGLRVMVSGSMREGFGRFASDIDFMVWLTDHHVLWDLNHIAKYNIKRCTLLLMECFETPPGYALLQLLPSTNNVVIQSCAGDTVIVSCEEKNDRIYISSSKYRKMAASLVKENPVQHGPCMSGRDFYTKYEFAYCFACRLWPSIASAFTLRCRSQAWPPNPVLSDIANSGCHVVPIGFKESPEEDLEWRISFSIAEQKLVYCMNHTQFMCYGLLKLFLKEVLTVEDKTGQSLLSKIPLEIHSAITLHIHIGLLDEH
ncbi:uncharacterized protein LOC134249304 [Saccostrea cucullata]|uniref:uncharacterized protein LOC134249304 n=1 Tax=Saccostrea cuccullata TaxID=36930 RepID=UPI002ED005B7